MSMSRRIMKLVCGWTVAIALVGCAASVDGAELPFDESDAGELGEDNSEVGVSALALGGVTGQLPTRGSQKRVVESLFMGFGMLYSMQLRTGALVDAITTSFYTPSSPTNRFSPGDPVFTRGPAGGTAGSPAPVLTCPAGFAAVGMYGRSGAQ